ncbi:MAG: hypothetical protein AAGD32_11055 [Planctomycetota bacterium]
MSDIASNTVTAKTVALVGHCGPDSSFLRMAVSSALPGAQVKMVDDDNELEATVNQGVDLLLFNRVLEFGFTNRQGQELLEQVREKHPDLAVMMVSNFDDAQQAAEDAGAKPGFGKNEIGTDKVKDRIRAAVGL